jgi:hypothetical protein
MCGAWREGTGFILGYMLVVAAMKIASSYNGPADEAESEHTALTAGSREEVRVIPSQIVVS